MAMSTSIVQPDTTPVADNTMTPDHSASLLSMLVLSIYAANKSKKNFRKMKRRFMWTAFKLGLKSKFSKARVSDRVLIYILLGIVALVLVFYYPLIALILAAVALILILAGVI